MEVSESSRITNNHPLEQSTQLQHDDGTTSCNFLSFLSGLGLDATNSMLALFQSSNELEWIPSCGVSRSVHHISKATDDLVHTPSLQVHHHQHHLHGVHASVHLQTQINSLNGEFGEFVSLQQHCETNARNGGCKVIPLSSYVVPMLFVEVMQVSSTSLSLNMPYTWADYISWM